MSWLSCSAQLRENFPSSCSASSTQQKFSLAQLSKKKITTLVDHYFFSETLSKKTSISRWIEPRLPFPPIASLEFKCWWKSVFIECSFFMTSNLPDDDVPPFKKGCWSTVDDRGFRGTALSKTDTVVFIIHLSLQSVVNQKKVFFCHIIFIIWLI